ncbi:MAG: divergent polysaccharide deacetylase family protein [Notoacmeibacter sp.]|nr:divergent polysaccharide deacetylase family protein [Notoacmeibacter sp.]
MNDTDGYRGNRTIDRPLGQNTIPQRKTRIALSRGVLASAAMVALVVGASGYLALRDQPFRMVTVELPAAAEPPAATGDSGTSTAPEPRHPAGSPAIITVVPDDSAAVGDTAPAVSSPGVIVIRDPSALQQNPRTAHLPDRALIEQSDFGPLPVRGSDGRRPFDVYARPWSGTRGARVAIVIGGLGLSQTGTQAAIAKLPEEVTLGFAPQGNSLGRWMAEARRAGHEVVLQVPFEPFDYPRVSPGRNTLTVDASPAENLRDLHASMGRMTNYTGIMNYMGARFLADSAAMKPVIADLAKRGVMFIDDGSSARSTAGDLAAANRVPFVAGDLILDSTPDRGDILKKLDQLEATARARGFAIGSGSAFDVTVDAVAGWVAEAKKRGIEIVAVSALAADPEK